MRVSNRLEFTENHRYVAYRDFALSGLDRRILSHLYQPMVGAFAVGLYLLLYQHLSDDKIGFTEPESQRKLFLGLDLEMNPDGRQQLVEHFSKLEAVGLVQTFRQYDPAAEETLYEYVLIRPLPPGEFFSNLHLTLLLRDKVGKPALLELKEELLPQQPVGLARFMNRDELTVPFYELFRLSPGPVDPELETAFSESAPAMERSGGPKLSDRIRHSEMLLRFPRGASNRSYVEKLHLQPEAMAQINFLAYKFDLQVAEICRLLDEDGIFEPDGTLRWDELQLRANLVYRQDRKRGEERDRYLARLDVSEAPAAPDEADEAHAAAGLLLEVPERFIDKVSADEYNRLLRREPYTRMLARYFPGTVPDAFVRIFERIDLNYKLPEPVINVLIHYVLGMNHAQRLTKSFIDSIASNLLAKGIDTFAKAVRYVREQQKLNETLERRRRGEDVAIGGASASSSSRGRKGVSGGSRKPAMPVVGNGGPVQEVSPEEREKMRELARKLKNNKG
ncbi:DnaD domain protein [Cohnella lubricantis]|uniref:DnaD domain protein n=1 Tax=Cohnella lubricantis TaxID=2163172 RepID=A0A841TBC7_9BACL|nr:DnaD domain protein [Cohnella lubricantis]MBB6678312.1 DnaD domain protein [Cohnella lubricantis]MBP2118515.1 replication initiation and membrane attachment protein [Cohnella lubricantis]